jgi:tRNA threonylcarbamoyladenosine biosynthesis protein TsaE
MSEGESVSLTVRTAAEMHALGRSLATALRAGDLVILSGGLGAGKTTLTQGIGAGLGVRGPVTSPTFVIARVHPPAAVAGPGGLGGAGGLGGSGGSGGAMADLAAPRPSLVHADAYRLGSALELDDLDLDTDTASSVTVVEWGEGMAEGLAADRLEISIAADPPAAGDSADASAGGSADASAGPAGEIADPALDMPRTVRISMVGARWEGVELPLAGLADRL